MVFFLLGREGQRQLEISVENGERVTHKGKSLPLYDKRGRPLRRESKGSCGPNGRGSPAKLSDVSVHEEHASAVDVSADLEDVADVSKVVDVSNVVGVSDVADVPAKRARVAHSNLVDVAAVVAGGSGSVGSGVEGALDPLPCIDTILIAEHLDDVPEATKVFQDDVLDGKAKFEPLERPDVVSPMLNMKVTESEEALMQPVIDLSCSWKTVTGCPGFRYRYEGVSRDEPPDNDGQTHFARLEMPELTPRPGGRKYSHFARRAFESLDQRGRESYNLMVDEYLKEGWWVPADGQPSDEEVVVASSVFMIPGNGEGKRDRLVVDLREVNELLGKCTAELPKIANLLGGLRVRGGGCLLSVDAKSAFYKIRLQPGRELLLLLGGNKLVRCNRMCFGLGVRPAGLGMAMNRAIVALTRALPRSNTLISIFVDDLLLSGDCRDLVPRMALVLGFLRKFGWEVSKKKCSFTTTVGNRPLLEDLLQGRGIPRGEFDLGKPVKYLSASFSFNDDGKLVMDCATKSRSWEGLDILKRIRERDAVSMGQAFKVAGMLGYQVGGMHAEMVNLADGIRAVYGKIPNTPWKKKVALHQHVTAEQASLAVFCAAEAVEMLQRLGPCAHTTPVFTEGKDKVLNLELSTDACDSGGGIALNIVGNDGSKSLVLEKTTRFKGPEIAWHSNRKEARALHEGMLYAVEILEQLTRSWKEHKRLVLTICCDNRSAVSWGNGGKVYKKTDSIGIRRLKVEITEALDFLRDLGVEVSIGHIPGVENVHADRLSRWYEQTITMGKTKISLAECLEPSRFPTPEEGIFQLEADQGEGSSRCGEQVPQLVGNQESRKMLMWFRWQRCWLEGPIQ